MIIRKYNYEKWGKVSFSLLKNEMSAYIFCASVLLSALLQKGAAA